ncbi:MAG: caspase family protein, partial [Proteobacteria bacterium]|nr:caspase family protein [Pseudomonadota bacterium]
GEPVTKMSVLIDGRPMPDSRGIKRAKQEGTNQIRVTVPKRDCEISLIAENRYTASTPSTIGVKWRGKEAASGFIIKPKLFVLAIGVSKYRKQDLRLAHPAKDAKDMAAVFNKQKGGLYRDVAINLLSDPVRNEVLDGLKWIEREVTANDVAVVFLAGHGVNDWNGDYYYLPADANPDKLKRTGVPYSTIKSTVSNLPGKVLAFIDTCHSGNIMGNRRRGDMADIDKIASDLASAENGVVVFASSTGRQYSVENDRWKNGAFTKALVEGLSGRADYTNDKKITINELDLFISERVKKLTNGQQTPTTTKPHTVPDFTIVIR